MIRIVKVGDRRIETFNARPAFPEEAEKAASAVLADIRKNGDAAVSNLHDPNHFSELLFSTSFLPIMHLTEHSAAGSPFAFGLPLR